MEDTLTKQSKSEIIFKNYTYNIVENVIDMRLLEDREYTSYDNVLSDWSIPNLKIDSKIWIYVYKWIIHINKETIKLKYKYE